MLHLKGGSQCQEFRCEYCGYVSTVTNVCRSCDNKGFIMVLENSLKDNIANEWDEGMIANFPQLYKKWLLDNCKLTEEQAYKIWEDMKQFYKIDVRMICIEHGVKGH